jgi:hypothetical protein
MELDAFGGMPGVPYPHQEPFGCAGGYCQGGRKRVLLNQERVIPGGLEPLRQAVEDTAAVVRDG